MSTVKAQVFLELRLSGSGQPYVSSTAGSLRLISSGTGSAGAGTPVTTYTDRTGAGSSPTGLCQTDSVGNLKTWVDKETLAFDVQRVSDNLVVLAGVELDPDVVTSVNGQTGAVTVTAASTLTPTATKTSAYTAAAGDYVLADTTTAGFTVTLPAAPADKAQVALLLAAGGNALTYAAGAGDTLGPTLSGSLPVVGEVLVVQYGTAAKVWRPVAARLPVAQLDTRYASTAAVAAKVASVTAASGKIVVGGTATAPTVDVGTGIPESAVTNLVTDLAAKVSSVTAGSGKIVVGGTAAAPTVDVGTGIPESSVTNLVSDLAARALLVESVNTVATSGATQTIPDVTTATISHITLTANCTFTFPTAAAGKSFTVVLAQDATGSRTVTWPATVRWAGGTTPTLTTTAAKRDEFAFICPDGSTWLGHTGGLNFS